MSLLILDIDETLLHIVRLQNFKFSYITLQEIFDQEEKKFDENGTITFCDIVYTSLIQ